MQAMYSLSSLATHHISPTTPCLSQSPDNLDAVPRHMVEAQLDAIAEDFPKWVAENEGIVTPDMFGLN